MQGPTEPLDTMPHIKSNRAGHQSHLESNPDGGYIPRHGPHAKDTTTAFSGLRIFPGQPQTLDHLHVSTLAPRHQRSGRAAVRRLRAAQRAPQTVRVLACWRAQASPTGLTASQQPSPTGPRMVHGTAKNTNISMSNMVRRRRSSSSSSSSNARAAAHR